MLSTYDEIKVVSLPDRKDRRRHMKRQLKGYPFEFFDALRISEPGPFSSPGAFGGVLSHALCLASAKGSILILEDDCVIPPEAHRFDVPECDIFWAGWEQRSGDAVIGAQCIGYSARAADAVARYMFALVNPKAAPDPVAAKEPGFNPAIRPPYDGSLVWFLRTHPEFKCVFEPLTRQLPSRSDITPGRWDRTPVLRNAVSLARSLRLSTGL